MSPKLLLLAAVLLLVGGCHDDHDDHVEQGNPHAFHDNPDVQGFVAEPTVPAEPVDGPDLQPPTTLEPDFPEAVPAVTQPNMAATSWQAVLDCPATFLVVETLDTNWRVVDSDGRLVAGPRPLDAGEVPVDVVTVFCGQPVDG